MCCVGCKRRKQPSWNSIPEIKDYVFELFRQGEIRQTLLMINKWTSVRTSNFQFLDTLNFIYDFPSQSWNTGVDFHSQGKHIFTSSQTKTTKNNYSSFCVWGKCFYVFPLWSFIVFNIQSSVFLFSFVITSAIKGSNFDVNVKCNARHKIKFHRNFCSKSFFLCNKNAWFVYDLIHYFMHNFFYW